MVRMDNVKKWETTLVTDADGKLASAHRAVIVAGSKEPVREDLTTSEIANLQKALGQ